MQIDIEQQYFDLKDRFHEIEYLLEDLKNENEDIYYSMMEVCSEDPTQKMIEDLTKEQRELYDLFREKDNIIDDMNDIYDQVLTEKRRREIEDIANTSYSCDRDIDEAYDPLSRLEKKYYREYLKRCNARTERNILLARQADIDAGEEDEEFDEDEYEEDD